MAADAWLDDGDLNPGDDGADACEDDHGYKLAQGQAHDVIFGEQEVHGSTS